MRTLLDRLYLAAGALAALFLIAIAIMVLLSIGSRMIGRYVPGLSEYAGYCMAASSFLALAYTFQRGGHIRVRLLLERARGARRRIAELWCLAVGTGVAGYLAWYAVKAVMVSIEIGDISEGADATPLWIPQLGMAAGAVVMTVAVADRLFSVLTGAPLDPHADTGRGN